MRPPVDKNAVTLVELILAVLLVNVVIMTGLSMELGIRRIFSSTDQEIMLMDEAAPIVAMVARDIVRGVGDTANATHSPYWSWPSGGRTHYAIVSKVNGTGVWDSIDFASAADYEYEPASYTLRYARNISAGVYRDLSNRTTAFSISPPVNGSSAIFIQMRKDPTMPNSITNAEISLNFSAQYRGFSIS